MVHSWQILQALHYLEYLECGTVSFCAVDASDCNTQASLSSAGCFARASKKIPARVSSQGGLEDLH
jgi:hypothetical protein